MIASMPAAPVTWAELAVTAAALGLVLATAYGARVSRSSEGYENKATGVDYEVFFAIVRAYKGILDRPPSETELQTQRERLESDASFDVPALERALRTTPEYRRLVALQKNLVYPEMEGLVTEQQIRAKVSSMYLATTGSTPDATTMEFLLDRYRQSQLNDAQLQALIESIYGIGAGKGVGAEAVASGGVDVDGANQTAEEALYGKLGLTAGEIARIVASVGPGGGAGVGTAGSLDSGAGGACPGRQPPACTRPSDDGSPDDLMAAVRQRGLDEVRAMCRSNARSDRDAELARAGYGPGDPIGSWTMPKPLTTPVCIASRPAEVRPDRSQTALIGTLLDDAAGTQNMNLF